MSPGQPGRRHTPGQPRTAAPQRSHRWPGSPGRWGQGPLEGGPKQEAGPGGPGGPAAASTGPWGNVAVTGPVSDASHTKRIGTGSDVFTSGTSNTLPWLQGP